MSTTITARRGGRRRGRPVTRRQRIDLELLLLVRRAERDAWVLTQPRVVDPDAVIASNVTQHAP